MNRPLSGAVELRYLTNADELEGLSVLHLVSERSPVRDLALVADFEDIGSVGPDTVVLLAPSGARGGWMISAALRYAWERRICALIVPDQPFTASVVELARRFEVSLFTTQKDMTRLAIDAALRLGTARAESAARVRAVVDRLAGESDPARAIAKLSEELDGARVWVESAGVRTFGSPQASKVTRSGATQTTTLVQTRLSSREDDNGTLQAEIPTSAATFGEHLLAEAAPSIRALLLEQQLAATRASLPVMSITALTGSPRIAAFHDPQVSEDFESPRLTLDDDFVAICLITEELEQLGTLVHQLWFLAFPGAPLSRFDTGWIGFLPAADRQKLSEILGQVKRGIVHTAGLPLSGGSSRVHRSRAEARDAAREAWVAARLSNPHSPAGSSDRFVEFKRIPPRLLGRLVPEDLAGELIKTLYPLLVNDPDVSLIIDAVLAYLTVHGSVSSAADRIGVHRNTLQNRLKRATQLGIDLSDPDGVLAVHLILAAAQKDFTNAQ